MMAKKGVPEMAREWNGATSKQARYHDDDSLWQEWQKKKKKSGRMDSLFCDRQDSFSPEEFRVLLTISRVRGRRAEMYQNKLSPYVRLCAIKHAPNSASNLLLFRGRNALVRRRL